MKKTCSFDQYWGDYWPTGDQLRPYFVAEKGKEWFSSGGNDTAGLAIEGVDGSENLDRFSGRIDITLQFVGKPSVGVFMFYQKRNIVRYSSKGDLTKLKTYVRTLHDDLRTLAFFIPFEKAWLAAKEFIETDGQLPKSIEWVNMKDFPGDPFPVPHYVPAPGETILKK